MKERTSFGNVLRVCDVLRVCAACTVFALAGEAAFASSENDGDAPAAADVPAAAPVPAAPQPRKWLSLHAYADIETAYVCRGYVWDSRPFSAQYVDAEINLADFGRLDGYVWTMSALSSKGHSTSMRNAYNEVDYGIKYSYDVKLAEDWTLVNSVCRQWVTNPGVRHNAHSLIDWQASQVLRNPFVTPYWKLRYIRRPYQAAYWCVGAFRSFALTDTLSFTIDFFGDLGNARHFRHLFGPKPDHPGSDYNSGLHALNIVLRLDWQATEHLGFYAFAAQYSLVSHDARDAVHASTAEEAKCDLTYGGVGMKLDF